jgi:WD40 repeat protein
MSVNTLIHKLADINSDMHHQKVLIKTASLVLSLTSIMGGIINISPVKAEKPIIQTQKDQNYNLRAHIWDVAALAFSEDGKTLVSGGFDETIQIWNLKTRKLIHTLPGHKDGVNAVAITPNGKILITAGGANQSSTDKTIRVWNLENGKLKKSQPKLLFTFKGHISGITALTISPDGETLASSSYDKTIKLWHLKTGTLLKTLTGHHSWVRAIAFSPDGETLVSGGGALDTQTDTNIHLWSLKTGKSTRVISGNPNPINFVAFTPDGKNLLAASETNIKIINSRSGQLIRSQNSNSVAGIKAIALSPQGTSFVTTSLDASVKLWQLSDGKLLQTLVPAAKDSNLDRSYPSSIRFSPDGKNLAIGHGGGAYLSNFPIQMRSITK